MTTIYGAAHDAGTYHNTSPGSGSFVVDGFEQIKGIGFGAVKLFFSAQYATVDYSLESWSSSPTTLRALAQTSEMATVLGDSTVKHYLLNCFGFTTTGHADLWKFPLRDQTSLLSNEYTEIYNLAEHLLQTYDGAGKTFVIQNWEGDWALRGLTTLGAFVDITGRRVDRMVAYFRARANAIEQARRDNPTSDVRLLHAFECNRVLECLRDRNITSVVNDVLPRLRGSLDLVSYSAYDSIYDLSIGGGGAWHANQSAMVSAIAANLPASLALISDRAGAPAYIGEWGLAENEMPGGYDAATLVQAVYDAGEAASVPYHIYWQIWDNEGTPPSNRGFWLIDDGDNLTGAGTKWTALLA